MTGEPRVFRGMRLGPRPSAMVPVRLPPSCCLGPATASNAVTAALAEELATLTETHALGTGLQGPAPASYPQPPQAATSAIPTPVPPAGKKARPRTLGYPPCRP